MKSIVRQTWSVEGHLVHHSVASVITNNTELALEEYRVLNGYTDGKVLLNPRARGFFFSGHGDEIFLVSQ